MVSRILSIVGLIGVAMLDLSSIVEATKKRGHDDFMVEHRSAESPIIRLPPGIVIPLPFVYPEYKDPREQLPSTVKPDLPSTEQSLGTSILENVRNTMLVSSSQESEVPIVYNGKSTRINVQRRNRHRAPLTRNTINNNNKSAAPVAPDAHKVENSKDNSDNEAPIEGPLKFGTRLRSSNASNNQQLVGANNCTNERADGSGSNDSEGKCQSPRTRGSPRKYLRGRTRTEVSMRGHSASAYRPTVPRRRRPSVDNSKEIRSDAEKIEPKSLAGRILNRTAQDKSREVEKDQE